MTRMSLSIMLFQFEDALFCTFIYISRRGGFFENNLYHFGINTLSIYLSCIKNIKVYN